MKYFIRNKQNYIFSFIVFIFILLLISYKLLIGYGFEIDLYTYYSYLVYAFGLICFCLFFTYKFILKKDSNITLLVFAVTCLIVFILNLLL